MTFPIGTLVYGAGDAAGLAKWGSLQNPILRQMSELSRVATNPIVSVAVQFDGTTGQSFRDVLMPPGHPRRGSLYTAMGETNTGDPAELTEFVGWADQACRAEQVVLVISGHGLAWQDSQIFESLKGRGLATSTTPRIEFAHSRCVFSGFNRDTSSRKSRGIAIDGSSRDYLDNTELAKAIENAGLLLRRPISVLVFDACLMSSLEILWELSGTVGAVVGSVDELSAQGLNLAGAVSAMTRDRPSTPQEIARLFPETFTPKASWDSCIAVNLSPDAWDPVREAFGRFTQGLMAWLETEESHVRQFRKRLRTMQSLTKYSRKSLCDIGSLHDMLTSDSEFPDSIRKGIDKVRSRLVDCILAKNMGSRYEDSVGMSLFVPTSDAEFETNFADYRRLRFAHECGWISVLSKLFDE